MDPVKNPYAPGAGTLVQLAHQGQRLLARKAMNGQPSK
jgi:hypothetical protein